MAPQIPGANAKVLLPTRPSCLDLCTPAFVNEVVSYQRQFVSSVIQTCDTSSSFYMFTARITPKKSLNCYTCNSRRK